MKEITRQQFMDLFNQYKLTLIKGFYDYDGNLLGYGHQTIAHIYGREDNHEPIARLELRKDKYTYFKLI